MSDCIQNKHTFVIYVVHHAFVHDEADTALSLLYNLGDLKNKVDISSCVKLVNILKLSLWVVNGLCYEYFFFTFLSLS